VNLFKAFLILVVLMCHASVAWLVWGHDFISRPYSSLQQSAGGAFFGAIAFVLSAVFANCSRENKTVLAIAVLHAVACIFLFCFAAFGGFA